MDDVLPPGLESGRVFVLACCLHLAIEGIGEDSGTTHHLLRLNHYYLAEPEGTTGRWRLYEQAGNTEYFWPQVYATIALFTLELYFEFVDEVQNGDTSDLFAVALPADNRTYEIKETLKALGGRWMPEARRWIVPSRRQAEALALLAEVPEKT